MTKRLGYVLAVFIMLQSLATVAREWKAADIPMVHLQNEKKYVCDPEEIMSQEMRDSTDFYLHKLKKEKKVESVFVIVSNVENADVFRVAQDIGNQYGVGDKKTNRGLVVVLALKDRKYFIAPGEGLEDELTDIECDEIARACIVKHMRLGKPDMAMLSTAKVLYTKFKTGETGLENGKSSLLEIVFASFLIGVVVFWFVIIFSKKNGNNGNNGNRNANRMKGFGPIFFGNPGHLNDSSFGGGGFSSGGSFGGGSFGGGGSGGSW